MITYEQWDKQSPVNGREAVDLIGLEQMQNDDIFILFRDEENVVIAIESIATLRAVYGYGGETWQDVAEAHAAALEKREEAETETPEEKLKRLETYIELLDNAFEELLILGLPALIGEV